MELIETYNKEEKEYTVTIPLEEYRELIEARNECDNLIDFIFNTAEYNSITEKLSIDHVDLEMYLRNVWSYEYTKTINRLKNAEK